MEVLESIIQVVVFIAGFLTAILGLLLFFTFQWPAVVMWLMKVLVSSLSLVFIGIALMTGLTGAITGSSVLLILGFIDLVIFSIHYLGVTRPPAAYADFENAFGIDWQEKIAAKYEKYFLKSRSAFYLKEASGVQFTRDIPYAIIPGTDQSLLCDIWQPPAGMEKSGLVFIFMHGGAFYFLDKDLGTRPLFNHLAAQGHVIMDVAYRLAPEALIIDMIHDVKRAIAWLREHAAEYNVDPAMIVLGGSSAGAHLALMTAYTNENPAFDPPELPGDDFSVQAVISMYGPADLTELYYHTNQHLTTRITPGVRKKKVPRKMPAFMNRVASKDLHRLGLDKNLENAGTMPFLMGGHPEECPGMYNLFSPAFHVHDGCPQTLLIHGQHDILVPVKSTEMLFQKLKKSRIPAICHLFPQTDHGFDLFLPKISPAAHNAIYDIERFLALIASKSSRIADGAEILKRHKYSDEPAPQY